jgi:hypothetical protein
VSTGQVFDGYTKSGTRADPYSYNYGIAVGAANAMGDLALVRNAANYLMTNSAFCSMTVGGYDILPTYHQGNRDSSGFNGIVFRWFRAAYQDGHMPGIYLPWAQANVSQAWAGRNADGLSWNNWTSPTPSNGLFSWDCSDTVSGMLNVPPTN